MSFKNWALGMMGKGGKKFTSKDYHHFVLKVEYHYKKLAVETCIDLIAGALARCEIQTFKEGKPYRGEMYYLLNVQPNINQNATQFFHKAIRNYFYNNECLIVMQDGELFVADDFSVKEYVFKPNIYRQVQVGDLQLDKIFYETDVIHLKLTDANMIEVIDGLYSSFGKLLASSMDFYRRKNNKRLLMKGDFLRSQDDETQKELDALFEEQMKNWFDPEKAGTVFNLQKGMEIEDMSESKTGAQKLSDSRDISNLIDDIFNFVAMGFHIPRGLLKGDLADIEKQTDNFIMFAVNPPAEVIADEFNRKMYKKEEYLKRTYLKIDTSKIKVIDIAQMSTALDKLFAIGGVTINDILEILGREPIDEDYADFRWVTKNYERVSNETALKGGDTE